MSSDAEMKALLNCPFCGSEANFGKITYSRPVDGVRWADDDSPVLQAFFVSCGSCGARNSNSSSGGHKTEERAATAWNTRTPDAQLSSVLADMRDTLGSILKAPTGRDCKLIADQALSRINQTPATSIEGADDVG